MSRARKVGLKFRQCSWPKLRGYCQVILESLQGIVQFVGVYISISETAFCLTPYSAH